MQQAGNGPILTGIGAPNKGHQLAVCICHASRGRAGQRGDITAIGIISPLPVIGVPIKSSNSIDGWDSVLSILQMPGGIPVGTLAIGKAGAKNAGLLAAAILATTDEALSAALEDYREKQTSSVADAPSD